MTMDQIEVLPNGWAETKLGDVLCWHSGGTPPTGRTDFYGGDIPWVVSGDLKDGVIIPSGRTITKDGLASCSAKWVDPGSVLIALYGATTGKLGLTTVPLTTNQAVAFTNQPLIHNRFLFYYLLGQRQALVNRSIGAAQSNISQGILNSHPFLLAPYSEQGRIVDEIEKQFSRLDEGVADLKRVQANLKRYRASVLQAACCGKLVPTEAQLARQEGRDYEPASELLQRILIERRKKWEENEIAKMREKGKEPADDEWKARYKRPATPDTIGLPELPEGWVWARAEQLCEFITKGTTPSADKLFAGAGDIPYIKVYNLTKTGNLDFKVNPTYIGRDTHTNELARSRVYPGDVLMNLVGPPLGKVSIVPDAYAEWNINQAIGIFRTISGCDHKYICATLLTDCILHWAISKTKTTAGQVNLTLEISRDIPIPLPPLAEQQLIVTELERRLSVIDQMEKTVQSNLKRADRLRQAILKKAFEGKLVPQDPNDEPASVLLEKIGSSRAQSKSERLGRPKRSAKGGEARVE